jgi:hypothetical protein
LKLNSQVVVGAGSFADISVGSGCALSLSAGAEAMIVPANNDVCVRVNDPSKAADVSSGQQNQVASQSNAGPQSQSASETAAQGLQQVGGSQTSPFAALLTPGFGAVGGIGAAALGGAALLAPGEEDGTAVGGGGTPVSQ